MSWDIAIRNDPVHSCQNLTEVAIQTLKKKKEEKKSEKLGPQNHLEPHQCQAGI